MTKHTPGRWKAVGTKHEGEYSICILATGRDGKSKRQTTVIAQDVYTTEHNDEELQTAMADAHFMAAAPYMLDALEKTENWLNRFCACEENGECPIADIREAIARAKNINP